MTISAKHPAQCRFTLQSLNSRSGTDREEVENWFADWISTIDAGDTYDELLDRLDGSPWGNTGAHVELPDTTLDPVYKRLVNIARKVRREMQA